MNKTKIAKGYINFFIEMNEKNKASIVSEQEDYDLSDELIVNCYAEKTIYDLIDGLDFLDSVRCGGFINSDGKLVTIFINDYISNIGLKERGICQGNFLVDGTYFEDLCKNNKVEVNWANK